MPYHALPDGTRLFFRLAGAGEPTLILLHGWCSNLGHWQPTARRLRRTHRVLSVDMRGHGRSDAPADGYGAAQLADDIAALARSSRIRGAVIAGHSMGGLLALELARRHPALTRALVLVDSAYDQYATPEALEETRLWKTVVGSPGTEGVARLYRAFFPPGTSPAVRALGRSVVADAARTPRHAALAAWRTTLTADIPAIARDVRHPVLFVNASHNNRTAAGLRAVLPQAEFAQVAGSGHFVPIEVPEQLAPMIQRFARG